MCVGLLDLRAAMQDYATGFDPDLLSCGDAQAAVVEAAAIEHMAAAVKALAAARAAQARQWKHRGHRSAEEELARATGTSVAGAREALALGRRLGEQPEVSEAARRGRLSLSQASAISEAVEDQPEAAKELIEAAQEGGSLAELKQQCAQVKAATVDLEARREKIRGRRHLRAWTDAEGEWHVTGAGNPEDGAQIMAALGPLVERAFRAARAQGQPEHPDAYRFDALVALAMNATGIPIAGAPLCDDTDPPDVADVNTPAASQRPERAASADGRGCPSLFEGNDADAPDGQVDRGSAAQAGGGTSTAPQGDPPFPRWSSPDPHDDVCNPPRMDGRGSPPFPSGGSTPTRPPGHGTPARRGGPTSPGGARVRKGAPVKLLVRVDLDTLMRGFPADGETCELVGFGPISVSAVHDLLEQGDPFVAAILTKGKQLVGVAHLGRQPTAHQRSALQWLYPTCAAQGCPEPAHHLQIDHRLDWSQTHITLIDWLDALCRHHHARKTQDGWALTDDTGKRPFVPPSDPRHPRHKPPPQGPP